MAEDDDGIRLRDPEALRSEEALEAGRHLFAQACEFFWATPRASGLPPPGLPEVAFAGRSNVGKSSLVNALTGQTKLARTSNTPGRTQQMNFFDLGARLWLVDLPGYGYAKVSRSTAKSWTAAAKSYLKGRATLGRVCLLIDGRHGIKESDEEMMALMDAAAVVYQIVLTKMDELPGPKRIERVEATARRIAKRPAAHPTVMPTSARTGAGIPELRAELAALSLAMPDTTNKS